MKLPVKSLLCSCLVLASVTALSACADEAASAAGSINGPHCPTDKVPYTRQQVGEYQVYMYEPDNAESPQIWQGPVCIEAQTLASACQLDLGLIKQVGAGQQPGTVSITTFSGSNATEHLVDPVKCAP
ncbi:hypothetical protein WH50_04930 [Pokkaliibacter plantistimulans]|uniref:NlpE C-terminal OB domain-containing protein n=1 Tax=Pokkaliibacter plantistimulans TaxID=1635171 RepID=A0ABX5M0J0_9GAMM|nr:hypothetical protein [Pokkaliibacter plantistimulans]PXF32434.1 hypothetical protein WH50_04930 [Pokkaliibacter plantistimulans]